MHFPRRRVITLANLSPTASEVSVDAPDWPRPYRLVGFFLRVQLDTTGNAGNNYVAVGWHVAEKVGVSLKVMGGTSPQIARDPAAVRVVDVYAGVGVTSEYALLDVNPCVAGVPVSAEAIVGVNQRLSIRVDNLASNCQDSMQSIAVMIEDEGDDAEDHK